MIVVLGDEERQIQNTNPYIQARMQRHPLYKRFIVGVQPTDERHPLCAKSGEDILNGVRVMICFMRFAILHVGGSERFAPRLIVIEATHSQAFEVHQMSGLFLNRPLVAVAPRKDFSR
jgi:hypothetical protein